MTTAHLGKFIKRDHPGAYDHIDDAVLGRAMQKRFPGMYDHFADDGNTVPETPHTLRIQLEQMAQDMRRCVFVARGSKVRINPRDYGARKLATPAGEFYYRPKAITPQEIKAALAEHRLPEILGASDGGYGAPDKSELRGPVEAVVSRDSKGETVHGALTDAENEQTAVAQAQKLTPPAGSVSVEPPATEISHRMESGDVEKPDASPQAAPLPKKRHSAGARWPKPGVK